jgi:LexA DNA binding domain
MSEYLLAPIQPPWRPPHPRATCDTNTSEHAQADWGCAQPVPAPVPLSATQLRMLSFIRRYQHMWGDTPLYREIGEACGLRSDSAVQYQIQRLTALGLVRKPPRLMRAICVNAVPVQLT